MFLKKINSFLLKKKCSNKCKFIATFFFSFLFLFCSLTVNAHVPPVAGATDCGAIVGSTFYSEYYDPPTGTPVSNSVCSWVKQGTRSCGSYCYNGVNYTLYNYKFICNAPLDSQIYVITIGLTLFAFLRKRVFLTFS